MLVSLGSYLGASATRRSIWRNSPSNGNPSLTWTLHWSFFIIVANNFGVGTSLEDGLGESKRTEVAKDLRFDWTDSLYKQIERFRRGSGKPKQNPPSDFDLHDALDLQPTPKSPPKKTDSELLGFDLSDALDDGNDGFNDGGRKPNKNPGGGFSDKDLEDIIGGGYQPDKGKGDGKYESNDDSGSGVIAETGTIAGIASALAMALIGAVSSYISYQQKKFCFNIQRGLNADYAKGQNLEGVSTEEPRALSSHKTLLEYGHQEDKEWPHYARRTTAQSPRAS
ncbi:CD99 antigen-like protein 2 isoform X2 [Monodelphis domestica]|uniref:CD99 antigen-like protein 2 isoform X2 n=1 Tax=Monodelphis domestica TaxID=13616 RepID=UPI0024E1D172|nr:CD99 antigen-like protein 2 isoform X2 [Monodelphis domestica]